MTPRAEIAIGAAALGDATDPSGLVGEHEIPAWLGAWLYDLGALDKGAGHKYLRRIPTGDPKRPWRYIYTVSGGRGIGHADEFQVGAAFKVERDGQLGHLHVLAVNGDKIKVRHNETGNEAVLTAEVLSHILRRHHAEAIKGHRDRLKADVAAVRKYGSRKQRDRIEAEVRHYGHRDLLEAGEGGAKRPAGPAQTPAAPSSPEKPTASSGAVAWREKHPERAAGATMIGPFAVWKHTNGRHHVTDTRTDKNLRGFDSRDAAVKNASERAAAEGLEAELFAAVARDGRLRKALRAPLLGETPLQKAGALLADARARLMARGLRAEVEIPPALGEFLYSLLGLEKSASHKFIRRVPTGNPKRPWKYYYAGQGVARMGDPAEIVVGAKFRIQHRGHDGHFEVVGRNGDDVVVRHDETGKTATLPSAGFSALIRHHQGHSQRAHPDHPPPDGAVVLYTPRPASWPAAPGVPAAHRDRARRIVRGLTGVEGVHPDDDTLNAVAVELTRLPERLLRRLETQNVRVEVVVGLGVGEHPAAWPMGRVRNLTGEVPVERLETVRGMVSWRKGDPPLVIVVGNRIYESQPESENVVLHEVGHLVYRLGDVHRSARWRALHAASRWRSRRHRAARGEAFADAFAALYHDGQIRLVDSGGRRGLADFIRGVSDLRSGQRDRDTR